MKSFTKNITIVYIFVITTLIVAKIVDNDVAMNSLDSFIVSQKIDKSTTNWKERLAKPPELAFLEGKQYFWHIVTNKGPIVIELMPQYAPMHVSSTIYLSKIGFYDNLIFHRVIPGFMAQGGDPTGTGRGNPGYRYNGEFHEEASHSEAGMLSMANSGPGTDGSQFFITFKATRFLDGRHTVFGKVVSGMDTLKALEQSGSQSGKPSEDLIMLNTRILNSINNQDSE